VPARILARRLLKPWLVKNPRELLTAGIGGALGTGVDVAVLVLLVGHHVSIPLATFIAALAGAVTNFTLNKYVAFRDRSPITLGQIVRYDVVAVVAALLMAGAMKIATARTPACPGRRQARLRGGRVRDLDLSRAAAPRVRAKRGGRLTRVPQSHQEPRHVESSPVASISVS
jgi:putative flippase GtrA